MNLRGSLAYKISNDPLQFSYQFSAVYLQLYFLFPFRDFSYIIITNESCSQSKTYKIRTQALEGIFPGNKYQEGIHVQGTAHGMTIIEL